MLGDDVELVQCPFKQVYRSSDVQNINVDIAELIWKISSMDNQTIFLFLAIFYPPYVKDPIGTVQVYA